MEHADNVTAKVYVHSCHHMVSVLFLNLWSAALTYESFSPCGEIPVKVTFCICYFVSYRFVNGSRVEGHACARHIELHPDFIANPIVEIGSEMIVLIFPPTSLFRSRHFSNEQ